VAADQPADRVDRVVVVHGGQTLHHTAVGRLVPNPRACVPGWSRAPLP
jgi:hypothetical protein